ncbi:class C sortase [Lentilactobacillus senioris]|nr:class C sortase [Lentilactobacillus senioris]
MRKWLAILLFILGLGLLSFPMVSNYYTSLRQQGTLNEYKTSLQYASKKKLKEAQQSLLKQQTYQQQTVNDPFGDHSSTAYGTDPLAFISIPAIDVELPVFPGTSDKTLNRYAGLVQGTDVPIGKKNQHSLITAHRGLPGAQLFTDLPRLEVGDKFYLKNAYGLMTYEVDNIKTIKPTTANPVQRDPQTNQVTLMTCTPYMINTHRLLVTGHRIPNESKSIPKAHFVWDWYKILMVALGVAVVAYLIYRLIRYFRNRKGGDSDEI